MSLRKRQKPAQEAAPREEKRGGRVARTVAVLAAVALVAAALAGGGLLFRNLSSGDGNPAPGPKNAAIVDQLSLTQPNPDFVASARSLLLEAGYSVAYFPGDQVSVDFYRDLPAHGYDLIILRVHSGIVTETDATTGEKRKTEYVSLFTSEPYDEAKYPEEQIGRLGPSHYYEGGEEYFGVGPDFIKYNMRGGFDKTLIIMMGCDGLRSQRTGQAFLDKGASAFVSWSKPVSASHTDAATQRLLEKLLTEGLPVGEAVAQTAAEVGPDPSFGAELRVLAAED